MRFPSIYTLVVPVVFVLWVSCNRQEPAAPPPAPGKSPGVDLSGVDTNLLRDSSPKYIQGAFTEAAALEVIYGLYDKGMECSKWVCKPSESPLVSEMAGEGEAAVYTRSRGCHEFTTSEGKKILLVTETIPGEQFTQCHSCAPVLGLALFTEIQGDWFIESLRKDVDAIGTWGTLPPHSLIKLGTDNYGVLFEPSFTGQGVTESSFYLAALVDGKFTPVLETGKRFSNDGLYFEEFFPEKAYSWEGEISTLPGNNPVWEDIVVVLAGKRPEDPDDDESRISPFEETLVFRFKKDQYELEEKTANVM